VRDGEASPALAAAESMARDAPGSLPDSFQWFSGSDLAIVRIQVDGAVTYAANAAFEAAVGPASGVESELPRRASRESLLLVRF